MYSKPDFEETLSCLKKNVQFVFCVLIFYNFVFLSLINRKIIVEAT